MLAQRSLVLYTVRTSKALVLSVGEDDIAGVSPKPRRIYWRSPCRR
jgi:hypothetical protein